jgi:hypothetical protein
VYLPHAKSAGRSETRRLALKNPLPGQIVFILRGNVDLKVLGMKRIPYRRRVDGQGGIWAMALPGRQERF